jgi:uncharacterized membrane protein YbhN (UPF0104 family)
MCGAMSDEPRPESGGGGGAGRSNWLWLRVAASAALLALLAWRVDFAPLSARLEAFRWEWYLAGLGTMAPYLAVQATLLRRLLRAQGLAVGFGATVRTLLVSAFLGFFLPGGVGSDAVLCLTLCRSTERKETVLSAVAFARVATLLGTLGLALAASFSPACPIPGLRRMSLTLLAALAGGYAAFVLLWRRRTREGLRAPTRLGRLWQMGLRAVDILAAYGRNPRLLLGVAPLVLLVGLMRVGFDYLAARAIGLQIPAVDFFVFAAAIGLVLTIPLTVAGLGVREGSYVYLFSLVGVAGADALTLALVSFSFTVAVALAGAGVYAACGLRAQVGAAAPQ